MALRGPQNLAFSWAPESTYGTAVARATSIPALSEDITVRAERVIDEAVYAGARAMKFEQVKRGNKVIDGSVTTPIYDRSMRELFEQLMGSETGIGPYTYGPGDLEGSSLTTEIVKSGIEDDEAWVLDGVKIKGATFDMRQGQPASAKWDLVGQGYSLSDTLSGVAYASGLVVFVCTNMTVSMTGAATFNVLNISVKVDNALKTDRYHADTDEIAEPLEAGIRMFTTEVTIEYPDVTYVEQQVAGTEVDVSATLTAGANSLAFAMNGDVESAKVSVSQRTGLIEQTLVIKGSAAAGGGADSTALNMVYTTV